MNKYSVEEICVNLATFHGSSQARQWKYHGKGLHLQDLVDVMELLKTEWKIINCLGLADLDFFWVPWCRERFESSLKNPLISKYFKRNFSHLAVLHHASSNLFNEISQKRKRKVKYLIEILVYISSTTKDQHLAVYLFLWVV